jgi:hypothetical protein
MDTDFLDWALTDFSGYVAADELYDGPFCILSAVDNRCYKRLLSDVLEHDPTHEDIRAFLGRLKTALSARALTLFGVTTDGSALYPEPLREVFGDVPHQICVLHIVAEVGKAVLGAVASARKGLTAQQPKLRRGRPSTPAAKQAARTKKRLAAQRAALFASRSLFVQRHLNTTERKTLWRVSRGFPQLQALLTHYGQWVQPARRQAAGPAPKPRWMPLPGLLYAQVIKTVRRRRLVRVSHRVVCGTQAAIAQVLAAHGWHINTAFIERLNLSMRQHVAAVGRRVSTFCKGEDGLRQQLVLYQTYYNFCLPHASLRLPLLQPEPTKGNGSAKRWQPQTPAMAAGLTDHVWTLREVLLFRVPPWPQPVGL